LIEGDSTFVDTVKLRVIGTIWFELRQSIVDLQ